MAPARIPQPRPASSSPDTTVASHAAAVPDDAERAWAFLARRTAWERRLTELRRDAAQGPLTGVAAPVGPQVRPAAERPEAA